MNSEERREARYRRRKARRDAKRAKTSSVKFGDVFSYGNLYEAYRKCRKGVAWKRSVQEYISQAPLNVYRTHSKLMDGSYSTGRVNEFDIVERGKPRHIASIGIGDRVVHRCLRDNALLPALSRSFIHDSGACMPKKGQSFAVGRLERHLREHFAEHGNDGYVLLFDFSGYFASIDHGLVADMVRGAIDDPALAELSVRLVTEFGEGLGLGSPISQVLALAAADPIDHYVKEVMRACGYGRYMDDGYVINPSKAFLRECLDGIRSIAESRGLSLHPRKTRIVKLSRGFAFMKARYLLLPSGRVLRRLPKKATGRRRRKMRAMARLVESGDMELEGAVESYMSWRDYAEGFNSHWSLLRMDEFAVELFGDVVPVQVTKRN